ncbi:class I SAM-dependent methyltransferase [Nesterenkonia muleiensis]|uniref:class I SAM-dependent methyltransferase n=1 Tax=Nesterenkonia muleiensis TaxID=2282648 RepID=UPI001300A935|nr:class I SAM-dependent methyltransferase [Nesterenkonia muleiensis]
MDPDSRISEDGSPLVNRPVPADWLALRREADHRAREKSAHLLDRLQRHLRASGADSVHIIDVGAGTGSNQAWLATRLGLNQHWTLLDHDAGLIGVAEMLSLSTPQVSTDRQVGAIEDLPALLESLKPASSSREHGPEGRPVLVTCAALLDLLTAAEAEILVEAVASAGETWQAAGLFSLTVTGAVQISPQDPEDGLISEAFDAHQRRGGILGPDAAGAVAALFAGRGMSVTVQETDWELSSDHSDLTHRYLIDRAAVAVEQDPALEQTAEAWVERRLHQLAQHQLLVRVGHTDMLVLPGPS